MDSVSPAADTVPPARAVYGAFDCDGMALALPISALREVVPWQPLRQLPCAAPAVLGGLDVRGTVVPVVDLGLALGRPAGAGRPTLVIVIVHAGHLLGMQADRITGMFESDAPALAGAGGDPAQVGPLYIGSLRRSDTGQLVSLLCTAALARLPGLPLVPDLERSQAAARTQEGQTATLRPVLLLRCGRFGLALDALAVHATLSEPQLQPSVLRQGACLGVLAYAGRHIAAVDLGALTGLTLPGAVGTQRQAVVLRWAEGDLALLVDEVLDVVPAHDTQRVPVPALALPQPQFFEGLWPLQALPPALAEGPVASLRQFYALSAQGLHDDSALRGLAATNTPVVLLGQQRTPTAQPRSGSGRDRPDPAAEPTGQVVITYDLLSELATPIEQVAEILRFDPALVVHPAGTALFGMLVDRGRTIPVLCLRALAGLPRGEWQPDACVLVVRSGDQWLGFGVGRLRAIEQVCLSHQLPGRGMGEGDRLAHTLGSQRIAVLRDDRGERTLRVLDLQQLADDLASGRRTVGGLAQAA